MRVRKKKGRHQEETASQIFLHHYRMFLGRHGDHFPVGQKCNL